MECAWNALELPGAVACFVLISRASTSLMSPSLPTVAGLPPFNNFFAARSFRALQLRAGPLQSLVDLANRVATRWLGFNGIGTIFNSFNGVLG